MLTAKIGIQSAYQPFVVMTTSGVFRIWQRGTWRARRARSYNGDLGAEQSSRAETLFAFERSMEAANSPIFF